MGGKNILSDLIFKHILVVSNLLLDIKELKKLI